MNGGSLEPGDCIKLVKEQPYTQALSSYATSGASDPFYVPFPAATTYALTAPSPAGSVARVDDYTLKIDITAASTSFTYAVNSIKNPFSQLQKTSIQAKHYVGCGAVATVCSGSCTPSMLDTYSVPAIGSLTAPSSIITTSTGTAANVVATTDGNFVVTIETGTEFPKFGGQIQLTVPFWYAGGTTAVFNVRDPKTQCSSS